MRKKRIVKAMVALVLVLAMLSGSALAASKSAKVFSPSMAVYRSAGGKRAGALRRGTSISVTGIKGSWARISYKGRTGYVHLQDIEFNSHVKATTKKSSSIRFITKSSVKKHIYYTATLAEGVTVYLAGVRGNSYLFYSADGSSMGFVSKSAVKVGK